MEAHDKGKMYGFRNELCLRTEGAWLAMVHGKQFRRIRCLPSFTSMLIENWLKTKFWFHFLCGEKLQVSIFRHLSVLVVDKPFYSKLIKLESC